MAKRSLPVNASNRKGLPIAKFIDQGTKTLSPHKNHQAQGAPRKWHSLIKYKYYLRINTARVGPKQVKLSILLS